MIDCRDKQVGGVHYKSMGLQPWDVLAKWQTIEEFRGFLWGNAIKYIARHKQKGGSEDIEKAIHYLERYLETITPKVDNTIPKGD